MYAPLKQFALVVAFLTSVSISKFDTARSDVKEWSFAVKHSVCSPKAVVFAVVRTELALKPSFAPFKDTSLLQKSDVSYVCNVEERTNDSAVLL